MKNRTVLLFAFSLLLTIAACSKENRLNRRITGDWNLDLIEYREFNMDTVFRDTTADSVGVFTFLDDGTGYLAIADPVDTIPVTEWSNGEGEVILILDQELYTFEVLTDRSKSQLWFQYEEQGVGDTIRTIQTAWHLSR